MRRPLVHRAIAALLGLWFAFVATEAGRVHACAMHGGATAEVAAEGTSAAHHGAHAAGHGDAHAAAPASDEAPAGTHHCSCPDASCGTSAGAILAPRVTHHFAIAVADVRAVFAAPRGRLPVATPYLRPFGNGPPASALA